MLKKQIGSRYYTVFKQKNCYKYFQTLNRRYTIIYVLTKTVLMFKL